MIEIDFLWPPILCKFNSFIVVYVDNNGKVWGRASSCRRSTRLGNGNVLIQISVRKQYVLNLL